MTATPKRPTPITNALVMRHSAETASLQSGSHPESVIKAKTIRHEKELMEHARQLESDRAELVEALTDAQEELRLIRMKDTGAVYDPTLRPRLHALLSRLSPQEGGKE